ncbi:ABC transporter substrate-binding protein [Ureaplasma canigenitalium]|uniref:ABC transporter substrate-binding protein n=1 Tax=Ureaplasma canigenitalium TaxID=42092 RepID=UPI0004E27784|nr:ABC transporter substrate-binding protein [Ureaplasma canigenitalium]
MKKTMNRKKLVSLSLLALTTASIVAVAAVSCTSTGSTESKTSLKVQDAYDFGLAVDAINSLNYIKYVNLRRVAPALVEGLLKEAPSPNGKIGNLLGLAKLDFKWFRNSNANTFDAMDQNDIFNNFGGSDKLAGNFYPLADFGFQAGALAQYINDDRPPFLAFTSKTGKVFAVRFALNQGASKWSDGKEVEAQDFIDAVQYILDLNTGSQLRTPLLNMNIRGSRAFTTAQEKYIQKFGKPYKNPFGRVGYRFDEHLNQYVEDYENWKPFSNQEFDKEGNPLDTKEVNEIKKAALSLGLWTGQMFINMNNDELLEALRLPENANLDLKDLKTIKALDKYTNKIKDFKLIPNPYFFKKQVFREDTVANLIKGNQLLKHYGLPKSRYDLLVEFEPFSPKSRPFDALTAFINKQEFLPVNRKFIETNGGIHNFGSTEKNFLTNGPFLIESSILGSEGYINLVKNKNYYSSNWTISNRIKIFFNGKDEVKSLWFKEGIISATNVPSSYQLQFWAREKYRKMLKKLQGYGTVGFQFNLDEQSRYESYDEYLKNKDKKHIPILDSDLRRAISYALNRESVLRLTGWTSSFVVTSWTAFGTLKDSYGRNIEYRFDPASYASEYDLNNPNNKKVEKIDYKDVDRQAELTKQLHVKKPKDAPNYKFFPLQNNTFAEHNSKSLNFENIERTDKAYDPSVALFYLERYKQKHPEQKEVTIEFVYPSSPPEAANAAITFKDIMENNLNGYVKVNLKSLPPNTYASFIASGKFDMTYANFDKYSGSDVDASMLPLLITDGIDLQKNKSQGYELNPTGSWTFKTFFELHKNDTKEEHDLLLYRLQISEEQYAIIKELAYTGKIKTSRLYNPDHLNIQKEGKKLKEVNQAVPLFNFSLGDAEIEAFNKLNTNEKANAGKRRIYLPNTLAKKINDENLYVKLHGKIQDQEFILPLKSELINVDSDLVKEEYGDVADLILNRKDGNTIFSFDALGHLPNDEYEILSVFNGQQGPSGQINPTKIYTSEYIKHDGQDTDVVNTDLYYEKDEAQADHIERIKRFFSGGRGGWSDETEIFDIIVAMEKIIREEVPILTIMDTDTSWSISSLGGLASNANFHLQFAYDYSKPPRAGLPTTPPKDGEEQ